MTSPACDAATSVVRVLRDAGHTAYFAGGCVRDRLLGLDPKDYDVASDARPQQVRELFRKSRYVGEAFGVVLVHLRGHDIEVATFRGEGAYEDGRRPNEVFFTDARHDAQRRDFTINGLFEDPFAEDPAQAIIDYVGGQADLRNKILRAIGDADARFSEDYLRMLRAIRFTARLGLTIDPDSENAIRRSADKLALISRERIGQECRWMLAPGTPERPTMPARAIGLIEALSLDAAVLTEPHLPATKLTTVAELQDSPYPVVLAAWKIDRHVTATHPTTSVTLADFCQTRANSIIQRWRNALCLSNDDRDALIAIFRYLPTALQWETSTIAQKKRLLAHPAWSPIHTLIKAAATKFDLHSLLSRINDEIPALKQSGIAPPPWITGDELVALGFRPGPSFKTLLDRVYDRQLEGELTSREAALEWVKRHA
ncbi:MAG: CCA tRNA nucleotidyltransferase [Phycisphaeraceae bacterium]|nr:CCA tRNA nucleotidyltransferase [Phycisphaeraceae bacterium]